VTALLRDTGALERSGEMAREHVSAAVRRVLSLPESPSRDRLVDVAHYAMDRKV
jgi:geranylgeranyl pyrophosphate synthase